VEAAIAQHIRTIQTEPVTEVELARIRTQANRFFFGNETPSERAGLYGYYQSMVGDLEPAFNTSSVQALDTVDLLGLPSSIYLQTTVSLSSNHLNTKHVDRNCRAYC